MTSNKTLALIALLISLVFFSLGRYTVSQTSTTTDKKVDSTDQTDTHQRETITEKKSPDGTDTIVTTIDTVKNETDTTKSDTLTKSIVAKASKLNISALAATNIHSPFGPPAYGLSVSKELLGPITVGAFGLTSGTIGISIGLDF